MSVNTAFQGRTIRSERVFEVTAEAIRAFAVATQASHPAHHDEEAAVELGHPGLVAPPTFPVTIAQQAEAAYISDPEAGIDFSRVVHGSERFTATRPLHAGDRVRAEVHIESVREIGGHAMVSTRTVLSDAADGTEIVAVTSAIVVRGEEA